MEWSVYNLMAEHYGITEDCFLVHAMTKIKLGPTFAASMAWQDIRRLWTFATPKVFK